MGYRCPVCDDPQADDSHLADHLAFTALVRGGDHEAWLDEHVPDWANLDTEALAPRVTEHADSAAYPQVFEDTTMTDHQRENSRDASPESHAPQHSEPTDPSNSSHPDRSSPAALPNGETDEIDSGLPGDDQEFDDETRAAIERARELTSGETEGENDRDEPSDAGNS